VAAALAITSAISLSVKCKQRARVGHASLSETQTDELAKVKSRCPRIPRRRPNNCGPPRQAAGTRSTAGQRCKTSMLAHGTHSSVEGGRGRRTLVAGRWSLETQTDELAKIKSRCPHTPRRRPNNWEHRWATVQEINAGPWDPFVGGGRERTEDAGDTHGLDHVRRTAETVDAHGLRQTQVIARIL